MLFGEASRGMLRAATPTGLPMSRVPHARITPGARARQRRIALPPGQLPAAPSRGWSLLCNGVVLLDDGGQLLPDGRAISPASTRTAADPRWRSRWLPGAA